MDSFSNIIEILRVFGRIENLNYFIAEQKRNQCFGNFLALACQALTLFALICKLDYCLVYWIKQSLCKYQND